MKIDVNVNCDVCEITNEIQLELTHFKGLILNIVKEENIKDGWYIGLISVLCEDCNKARLRNNESCQSCKYGNCHSGDWYCSNEYYGRYDYKFRVLESDLCDWYESRNW